MQSYVNNMNKKGKQKRPPSKQELTKRANQNTTN